MAEDRLTMTIGMTTMPETAGAANVVIDVKDPVAQRDRWVRRRIALAWGLLVLNTLTFFPFTYSGRPLVVPIPSTIGKGITQGALTVALILVLTVNRRMAVRPNAFLFLVSLLAVEALLTSVHVSQIGNAYRSFRFAEFVVVLWLLSPWWGRRDLLLVKCHLAAVSVFLGSVVLGLLVAPRAAMDLGRLEGVFWPTPPGQIAEFAGIMVGLVVVLWLDGLMSGRMVLAMILPAGIILVLTHARGALIALMAAIVVAGLSLFITTARVRKLFTVTGLIALIVTTTLSGFVKNWWARGEKAEELATLTGRTAAWAGVLNVPRDQFDMLSGFGLSNQGYSGLYIDNSWLIAYNDQGLYAVVICAAMLIYLFITACFRARGVQRALALFLVTYCILLSFEQSGLSSPSTFLLYLMLAASLLAPAQVERSI
jgi:hypothetical protein